MKRIQIIFILVFLIKLLCFFCEFFFLLFIYIWELFLFSFHVTKYNVNISIYDKYVGVISKNPICYICIGTSVLSVASGIRALVNSIVWSGSMNWFDYAVLGDPGKPGYVVARRAHIFRRGEFLCCVVNLDST